MEEFKERLKEEYNQLYERISKLYNFMSSSKFEELSQHLQLEMSMQFNSMNLYGYHLGNRMHLLGIDITKGVVKEDTSTKVELN